MEELKDLTKEELLELIKDYNDYIQGAADEDLYIEGWTPVCIMEFYESTY